MENGYYVLRNNSGAEVGRIIHRAGALSATNQGVYFLGTDTRGNRFLQFIPFYNYTQSAVVDATLNLPIEVRSTSTWTNFAFVGAGIVDISKIASSAAIRHIGYDMSLGREAYSEQRTQLN